MKRTYGLIQVNEDGSLTQLYLYNVFNALPTLADGDTVGKNLLTYDKQLTEAQFERLITTATRHVLNQYPHMANGHPNNLVHVVIDALLEMGFAHYVEPPTPITVHMVNIINSIKATPKEVVY